MDAEKFIREVLRLWMEEQGIKGTVVVSKKDAATEVQVPKAAQ